MFQLSPLVVSPEILVAKGGTMWAKNGRCILPEMPDFHVTFRNLLQCVNLRHGTDGFTSPPKGGMLRIFFALKNAKALAGFEPANLGTKGQHATSRPPKPLSDGFLSRCNFRFRRVWMPPHKPINRRDEGHMRIETRYSYSKTCNWLTFMES